MAPELIADSGKNKEGALSFQFENIALSGNFKIVVESGVTWKLKAKSQSNYGTTPCSCPRQ